MYSTDYFIQQFSAWETQALVDRLATPDLGEPARDALVILLLARGLSEDEIGAFVHQAKKDRFRRTGVDNLCDSCGNSALLFPFTVDGQRFCNVECFHTSRLRQAEVDVSDEQARERARLLREGSCPRCGGHGLHPDLHATHHIVSFFYGFTTSTQWKLSCRRCANRRSLWSALGCAALGWWSVAGLFRTPFHIFDNLWEILRRRESDGPSEALVEWARTGIAEARMQSAGLGRYGLGP